MMKALRWQNLLLGLIGICVVVGAWWMPALAWDDFHFGLLSQITLAGLGLFFIWVAFQQDSDFSPLLSGYQTVAVILLNTLLFLLLAEMLVSLGIITKVRVLAGGSLVDSETIGKNSSYYADEAWSDQFWEENVDSQQEMIVPYVRWRLQPFDGEHINVTSEGLRFTPNTQCGESNAFNVFVFGGSTVWGVAVPDWGTIPAYLQEAYVAQTDRPVCVTNFGQVGYITTQDLITLIQQLQKGNVPDAVIMYGGFNDVYGTQIKQEAGTYFFVEGETAGLQAFVNFLEEQSNLVRVFAENFQERQMLAQELDAEQLADEAVSLYMENYRMVDALSQAYGFEFAFLWQPMVIFGDKPLTEREQKITSGTHYGLDAALLTAAHQQILELAPGTPHLYVMEHVFDETESQIWIDWVHLLPEGNQIVAEAIVEVFNPLDI